MRPFTLLLKAVGKSLWNSTNIGPSVFQCYNFCMLLARFRLIWDPLANWMKNGKNVSLDQDVIRVNDDQVLVIRIIEGNVGLITIQGVHHLLDVSTHESIGC